MTVQTSHPEADFLFEVSWEVANMVGGIHTVLASKAEVMRQYYGENYVVIGPRLPKDGQGSESFIPGDTFPGLAPLLAARGLRVETGRWNVPGEPRCLLVDFSGEFKQKDEVLAWLWNNFGVDSISGGWDYVEPVLFAWCAGRVIEALAREQVLPFHHNVVAQWHEWLSAAGMLHLRRASPQIASVFTTHATVLGRAVWGSGKELSASLKEQSTEDCARALNVLAKHTLERAAVREADCFTTVSDWTASEAKLIFGREPEVLLPNGLGDEFPPPLYRDPDSVATARYSLLRLAQTMTSRPFDRDKTLLLLSAGRYEYLNKGVNIVLDALAQLRDRLAKAELRVICFLFFPGDVAGPNRELLAARSSESPVGQPQVCTHELHDARNDPICRHLERAGLQNKAGDRVNVAFAPIYLNGRDAVIKSSFYELLPAFDLTLFPSLYEPWGYTPLESIAYGVPTVTSDLAGFGRWANRSAKSSAVHVLARENVPDPDSANALARYLTEFAGLTSGQRAELRQEARRCANLANWRVFAQSYRQAHRCALAARDKRMPMLAPSLSVPHGPPAAHFFGSVDTVPRLRTFTVKNSLPASLAPLRKLARNLWWTWHEEAGQLFAELDHEHWARSGHNPVVMLESLPQGLLQQAARDGALCARVNDVVRRLDEYMAKPAPAPTVAYFCMEYGLHECLPLYSGGLGVLAGDHLKAASDMNAPLVAVGIAWRNGYFTQRLDHHGNQLEDSSDVDFGSLPLEPVLADDGSRAVIYVRFPGRSVAVQAWKAQVGRIVLYLLDTDIASNRAADREITSSLYRGDQERRLQQELVLGVGGRKLLVALGIKPAVYHLNEGHAALVVFNRLVELVRDHDLDYRAALELVRQTTVFTTHTPVPAGHDTFNEDLLRPYLSLYEDLLHKSWERLMALGRYRPDNTSEPFSMTLLALHASQQVNAVSDLHRRVTQRIFQRAMPGFVAAEVPVHGVTNGVHVRTWLAPGLRLLADRELGANWDSRSPDEVNWQALKRISDEEFTAARHSLKQQLFAFVRQRLEDDYARRHDSPAMLARVLDSLDERALVVGYARRFASYKRPTLLLRELDELKRLAADGNRPVLFLFAGKSHPDDQWGKRLLQEVFRASRTPELAGRVVLLEDYDLLMARMMVRGCDVWLNVPAHLMEACGTSGMKAAMNGVLNLSVLDGWWAEGHNGKNGWAVGAQPERYFDQFSAGQSRLDLDDEADARHLHVLLDRVVLPQFHAGGIARPSQLWQEYRLEAMISGLSNFSAVRMLHQYTCLHYEPARRRAAEAEGDAYSAVRATCALKRSLATAFPDVEIIEAHADRLSDGLVELGTSVDMRVTVSLGKIAPEQLRVEFLVAPRGLGIDAPACLELSFTGLDERGCGCWEGSFCPSQSGSHQWGVRVRPVVAGHEAPASDFAFVKWL